jgi:hypothetical protein
VRLCVHNIAPFNNEHENHDKSLQGRTTQKQKKSISLFF